MENRVEEDMLELRRLNATVLEHSSEPSPFRTTEVLCVARDGNEIAFCEPQWIDQKLRAILEVASSLLRDATSANATAYAAALLWMGIIAVHPFADGNGRTAFRFIVSRLDRSKHRIDAADYPILRRYLIRGDVNNDLRNLTVIINSLIKRAGAQSCPTQSAA